MHCIDIIIVDEKNLQLVKEIKPEILAIHLNQNFYGIPSNELYKNEVGDNMYEKPKNILYNTVVEYVSVSTDYFGGMGEQSATFVKSDSSYKDYDCINDAMKDYGVVKEENDHDIFDTLRLGNYRTNEDFYQSVNREERKETEPVLIKSLVEDSESLEFLLEQKRIIQEKIDKLNEK